MRRRLLVTYLSLTTFLIVALEIPLGLSLAMNEFHHVAIQRIDEAQLLASAASGVAGQPAEDPGLVDRLDSYGRDKDATVLLFDAQGDMVFTTRPGRREERKSWRTGLERALKGRSSTPLYYSFNIHAEPLFVAEPIIRSGRTVGALATISPTTSLRARVTGQSLLLLGGGLVAVAVAAMIAVPLSHWSLRPVQQLHHAVQAIASGHYGVRAISGRGPKEIRELADSVNSMTDQLVAVMEVQRCFVADASHQMRNPLTALRLRVEALERAVTEEGRPHLAVAVAEADRLGRILDELLTLARARPSDSDATTVEVRSVAEARARAWSDRAEEADVTIVVKGQRCAARSLPGALDQALDVLLDNAIGFSPPGARVTLRTWAEGDRICAAVEDEGPGMSAEDKTRATDRFWRGNQPVERPGSGLGLAIAKALLAASDGGLQLSDASPHGLIARIDLPRASA